MFLPDHQNRSKMPTTDYAKPNNFQYNVGGMSKSSIFNPGDQKTILDRPPPQQFQYHKQETQPQQHKFYENPLEKSIQDLGRKLEKVLSTVEKHEDQINTFSAQGATYTRILNQIR